jgi:hypothetical protein
MIATYNQLNKGKKETCVTLHNQIKEIEKKLERLEERLFDEEIERAMFDKYHTKFIKEQQEIEKQLAEVSNQKGNSVFHCISQLASILGKKKAATTIVKSMLPLLWCGPGLNRRHKDFQSFALPTELPHQNYFFTFPFGAAKIGVSVQIFHLKEINLLK